MSRTTLSLNGQWELRFDSENVGKQKGWAHDESFPFDRTINVPSTWNLIAPDYEGVAFYRTRFTLNPSHKSKVIRLKFGAVNYRAEVYLNGHLIGTHDGGYTPFIIDITKRARFDSENILVVRVVDPPNDGTHRAIDNLRHMEIPSGKESWYVSFSGIWQDVELIITDTAFIEDVFVIPDVVNSSLSIKTILGGTPPIDSTLKFTVTTLDGEKVISQTTSPSSEQTHCISLENIVLWSLDNPALYLLTTTLTTKSGGEDSITIRFGMRDFRIQDNSFLLNGKHIMLKGVLNQQQYPENLAYPESYDDARRIVRLLKDAGFNLIRMHIRPTVPWFLDICDEEGILVFEEPAIGWIVESEHLREHAITEVRDMVKRDRNHPSVVIWGILNESGVRGAPDVLGRTKMYWHKSDMGVQKIKSELVQIARTEDPSRFITDDSGRTTCSYFLPDSTDPVRYFDNHLYLAYPISHTGFELFRNIGQPEDFFRSHQFEGLITTYHRVTSGGENTLFFQSEFGCGGLPLWTEVLKHYHNSTVTYRDENIYRTIDRQLRDFYDFELSETFLSYEDMIVQTQEVQAMSVKRMIEALRANPRCSGYVLTQLHDTDYECNAGILDPVLNPKRAYESAKTANKPLHIVLETFERCVYPGGNFTVTVYVINDELFTGSLQLHITVTAPSGEAVRNEILPCHPTHRISEIYTDTITDVQQSEGAYMTTVELLTGNTLLDSASYNNYIVNPTQERLIERSLFLVPFEGNVRAWMEKNNIPFTVAEGKTLSHNRSPLYIVEPTGDGDLKDQRIGDVLRAVNDGADALFLGLPVFCLSDHDEKLQELRDKGKYVCWCSPTELENNVFPFPINFYDSKPRFAGAYHYFKKHRVFEGLAPGNILDDRCANILPDTSLKIEGAHVLGGSFGTPIGWHKRVRGCEKAFDFRSGADLCVAPYGKGRIMFSTYKVVPFLGRDPVADRLLWNLVSEEW